MTHDCKSAGGHSTTANVEPTGPNGAAGARPELAAIEDDRRVLFAPFTWHDPEKLRDVLVHASAAAEFAGQVRDVACGLGVVLAALERDSIDEDCADCDGRTLPAMFGMTEAGHLQRLAITTLGMLAERAERINDWIGDTADLQHIGGGVQ